MVKVIGTSIKFDAETHAAITRAAKARGVSTSEMIRGAVQRELDICPTCGRGHGSKGRHARRAQAAA